MKTNKRISLLLLIATTMLVFAGVCVGDVIKFPFTISFPCFYLPAGNLESKYGKRGLAYPFSTFMRCIFSRCSSSNIGNNLSGDIPKSPGFPGFVRSFCRCLRWRFAGYFARLGQRRNSVFSFAGRLVGRWYDKSNFSLLSQ